MTTTFLVTLLGLMVLLLDLVHQVEDAPPPPPPVRRPYVRRVIPAVGIAPKQRPFRRLESDDLLPALAAGEVAR